MNIKDISGHRFGRLVAKSFIPGQGWLCECDCGNTCIKSGYALSSGNTRSCGCLQQENRMTDYTGKRFGRLTGIKYIKDSPHTSIWLWRCDCGTEFEHSAKSIVAGNCVCCPDCARKVKQSQAEDIRDRIERDESGRSVKQVESIKDGTLLKNNTSGVRGVSWHNGSQKWVARMQQNGKTVTIGYFSDIEDAKRAREEAVKKTYSF